MKKLPAKYLLSGILLILLVTNSLLFYFLKRLTIVPLPVIVDNDAHFNFPIRSDLKEKQAGEILKECWLRTIAAQQKMSYQDLLDKLKDGQLSKVHLVLPFADWGEDIKESSRPVTVDLRRPLVLEFATYEENNPLGPPDTVGLDGSLRYRFAVDKNGGLKITVFVSPGFAASTAFSSAFLGALTYLYHGRVADGEKEPIVGQQETLIDLLYQPVAGGKNQTNPPIYGVKQ